MSNTDNTMNRLVRVVKKISSQDNKPDTMTFGIVTSINPLEIELASGITLTENFLFLGQNCRPHKVTIPHNHLINALESEKTKAITTTSISAGVAVDVPQKTGSYSVKTQEINKNNDKGIDERTLKTETKSGIDLGGASLSMNINIAGSVTAGTSPVGPTSGAVTTTTDLSTFTPSDNGHEHIIPEHSTQDVHFPNTNYEESVTIEIYPRLKVDDKVLMFAFNNYQMYYVAERIEE